MPIDLVYHDARVLATYERAKAKGIPEAEERLRYYLADILEQAGSRAERVLHDSGEDLSAHLEIGSDPQSGDLTFEFRPLEPR